MPYKTLFTNPWIGGYLKQSTLIHGFIDLIWQIKSAKPRRPTVAESSGVTGNLDKTLLDKNNS